MSSEIEMRVAKAICIGCEENPHHSGDARGNKYRWQDYIEIAKAAIAAARNIPLPEYRKSRMRRADKPISILQQPDALIYLIKEWSTAQRDFDALPEDAYLKNIDKLSAALAKKKAAEFALHKIAKEAKND